MTKKPERLEMPKQPLKYRVSGDDPSPREYELLEFARNRPLSEAEAAELKIEQDSRTAIASAWAQYHEELRAYQAQARA